MSSAFPYRSVVDDPSRFARHAADAERAATRRMAIAIDDLALLPPGRLDDRTRAAVMRLAEGSVAIVERHVAGEAARAFAAQGMDHLAVALDGNLLFAWGRLLEAGLMRDAELTGEWIAQGRLGLLDESLAALHAQDGSPTLVTALVDHPDPRVREATLVYLIADSAQRLAAGGASTVLPAPLHAQLTWWVAAVLREGFAPDGDPAVDRVLAEAAQKCIAAHDDLTRVEPAAAALAAALADEATRGEMLVHALDGARAALFVALLAHALAIDPVEARALLLDSASDMLWIALRAAGLPREAIARAGFLLTEADRDRDLGVLIEQLDPLSMVSPAEALRALSTLTLPREFRVSLRKLRQTAWS